MAVTGRILAAVELTRTTDPTRLDEAKLAAVVELLRGGDVVVLSGAGLSTESGIPDYRGPDGKRRVTPMTYGEFVASADNRRRYWARSFVGWRRFAAAGPNDGHRAVAALQRRGLLRAVITQNVDGLHQAGGRARRARAARQPRPGGLPQLRRVGPARATWMPACARRTRASRWWPGRSGRTATWCCPRRPCRPSTRPRCLVCASDLVKPDVVFFGESVPKPLVERCFDEVERSRGLLVLGSSLQVMSGYRFVRRAASLSLPVAIVTRGATRGDEQATIRLDAPLGVTLSRLVAELDRAA